MPQPPPSVSPDQATSTPMQSLEIQNLSLPSPHLSPEPSPNFLKHFLDCFPLFSSLKTKFIYRERYIYIKNIYFFSEEQATVWGETVKGRGSPGSYGGRDEGRGVQKFQCHKSNKKILQNERKRKTNQPQIEVSALCNRTGTIS